MSGFVAGFSVVAGCAIALLGYAWIAWWKRSTSTLGQPTPTSARVVSEKLDQATREANAIADAEIASTRQLSPTQLLDRANALREKGRGR